MTREKKSFKITVSIKNNCNRFREKVDIARYVKGYESIVPVGAVTQIRYSPQREQRQRQGEQKEHPFHVMLQMQLKEAPMEENQSFQLYC